MSPLPPGPAPLPGSGSGAAAGRSDLPPPSYEEFLRIAGQQATGGSSADGGNHQRQQQQLTAAASAIVAASGGILGSSLYPTLSASNYQHQNQLQAQVQAQVQAQAQSGEVISDVSSIGSDSCGHLRFRQSAAAAALTKTSVEPNLTVGIDGRLDLAAASSSAAAAASPLRKPDGCPAMAGVHDIHGIHGSSPLPLDASSGAESSGNKSAKSSKASSMLIVRAAEPYVRPPPQPDLDLDLSLSAGSVSSSASRSVRSRHSQGQSQCQSQSQCRATEDSQGGSVTSSSVGRRPKAAAVTTLVLPPPEDACMEPSAGTCSAEDEGSSHREVQRQLQRQVKASRAAAALMAVRPQGQASEPESEAEPELRVQQGAQGPQQQPRRPSLLGVTYDGTTAPLSRAHEDTISSNKAKAERRLSIPKAEVGASSRDTIRCLVPPPATSTNDDRHRRRLSLTEVRKYLDSDSEPEAEAEVKRLTAEVKAQFEASTSTPPRTSSTAMINADGIPTSVLARRHTYTVGSYPASSSSYNYNGVGVSPNTTLHTSITTLDDPFGNQRRRASMSKLHQGSPSYESSHPRGRLSVTDTRFLLLDPNSEDDDDGDDADDEGDNGGGSNSKPESSRTGRRHKRLSTSFRRRSSSASATALAALVPSASPAFPTGSVGGTSDDGSENLQERHPSFVNRRKTKCSNKNNATPRDESAEPPTHSAEHFAASCHDVGCQGIMADHGAAVRAGLSKSDPGLRLPLGAMDVGFLPLNDTTDSKEPTAIHRATSLLNLHAKSGTVETAEYNLSASGKRYPRSASIDLLRSRLFAAPSTDAAGILSRVPQRESILTVRTMEESIGKSGDVCREMGRLRRMSRLGSYHGSMEDGDEVQLDAAAAKDDDSFAEGGATMERRRSSTISFNQVEVRSYPITAGDHPCVTSGPPLTLQWDAVDQRTIDLDDYESTRPQYRSREQMYMPAKVRVEALRSEGHARSVIEESAEKAKESKEQRKQTRRKSGVIFAAEHALELSKRGLKNMVHRKKKDEEKKFLRAAMAADDQFRKARDDSLAKEADAIDALAETEDLRGLVVSIGADEMVEGGSDDDRNEE